jgi:hypothetical protein
MEMDMTPPSPTDTAVATLPPPAAAGLPAPSQFALPRLAAVPVPASMAEVGSAGPVLSFDDPAQAQPVAAELSFSVPSLPGTPTEPAQFSIFDAPQLPAAAPMPAPAGPAASWGPPAVAAPADALGAEPEFETELASRLSKIPQVSVSDMSLPSLSQLPAPAPLAPQKSLLGEPVHTADAKAKSKGKVVKAKASKTKVEKAPKAPKAPKTAKAPKALKAAAQAEDGQKAKGRGLRYWLYLDDK